MNTRPAWGRHPGVTRSHASGEAPRRSGIHTCGQPRLRPAPQQPQCAMRHHCSPPACPRLRHLLRSPRGTLRDAGGAPLAALSSGRNTQKPVDRSVKTKRPRTHQLGGDEVITEKRAGRAAVRVADRRQNRRTELHMRVRVCASQMRMPESRVSKGPSSPLGAHRPRLVSSRRSGTPRAPRAVQSGGSLQLTLRASALPPTTCRALPRHGAPTACSALASSLRSHAAAVRVDTESPPTCTGYLPHSQPRCVPCLREEPEKSGARRSGRCRAQASRSAPQGRRPAPRGGRGQRSPGGGWSSAGRTPSPSWWPRHRAHRASAGGGSASPRLGWGRGVEEGGPSGMRGVCAGLGGGGGWGRRWASPVPPSLQPRLISPLSSQGRDVSTGTSALSTDMEKQFRARRWPFPQDQRRLLGWLVLCLPRRSEQGPPDG